MKMKNIFLLLFCLFSAAAFSQEIEVLDENQSVALNPQNEFEYLFIEPQDTNKVFFVALVRATGDQGIARLFEAVRRTACKAGANCFRVEEYIQGDKKSSLTLRTYYAYQEYLLDNDKLKERNVIYVFGNDKSGDGKTSFKFNGEKKEVKNREYFRYENAIGDKVKISKGGFTGTSVTITGDLNKPSSYLTLSGLAAAPFGAYAGSYGAGTAYGGVGAGVSISTGRINYIDLNFANLLLNIWTEKQD
jgi:hypothetical protein